MHTFNKKRFDLMLKVVRVITQFFFIITLISLTVIGFALGIGLFVPSNVFEINLGFINTINIEIMSMQLSIPTTIFEDITLSKSLVLIALVTATLYMGFFSFVAKFFGLILKDVADEKPFSISNVKRLYVLGYAFIIAGVILPIGLAIASYRFIQLVSIDANVNYSLETGFIFIGFLILILTSIFHYGAYLQDEVDQTV